MIYIVVILFYLKESNKKHYKLFEKFGETREGTNIYSRQNENLEKSSLFYPNERAKVTIRPCEILFNKNGSSKYIFKDDWKEIATINNNTGNNSIDLSYSKKIITKEGVNKSDFNNFSEETRCFKMKNDNNDLNTRKYKENALISYHNDYTTLQTTEGDKNEYMQMNFNPSLSDETDYHKYIIDSICSYTYDTILTPPLKNVSLYSLFIDNDNIIQNIDKIEINASNNSVFDTKSFSLTELLDTSSTTYYYDNDNKVFKFQINNNEKMRGIIIYKFERNLLCDKEEIISYDKLITDYTMLNTVSLINVDKFIKPIDINNTELTPDILDKFRIPIKKNDNNNLIESYESKNFTDKKEILEIIKNHIDDRIDILNVPTKKGIETKKKELVELEKIKNAFADKISTIDKYIINIITIDSHNYDEETKTFFNKYLKTGKISYQKHIQNKILEPIINDPQLKATLIGDNIKNIDYSFSGNGQILAMPHFPDAYLIDNTRNTLSQGGWTIQSSLKTLQNQGLSAILKNSNRRDKTHTIRTVQTIKIDNKVIFYSGNNFDGRIMLELTLTIGGAETLSMPKIGSIKIPDGFTVDFYKIIWDQYALVLTLGSDIQSFSNYYTLEPSYVSIRCNKNCNRTKQVIKETPYNSAYGADGINPEITITMPTTNYISGFEFYGINELYNRSHNAKNIEVFGKSQDANGAWITTKVLTFILPKNASWNNSPFYKLDIPGEYKQIVFKIKNNWGNKSSTKIGSITLHHIPITINTKSMKLPTNISVRINGITHELTAGDYIMSADIKNKIYTFTHTQTGREIVKLANANNLIISYDTPKDINSLLTYNKNNISFEKFTKETQEKNNVDNFILLTLNKNLDTFETYKIEAYVYNNISYIPNIKLYDSSKNEINREKYKVNIKDYPNNKNIIILTHIYIIVDISITGAIYLKTTKNNNDLLEYNRTNVNNIIDAVNQSTDDSFNSKNLYDLRDIFNIIDKEDEIADLELLLIQKSAIKKNEFDKTILSIRRDIEDYEDDITINKLKNTYYNMANLDDMSNTNNDKVYHNKINIKNALEITDKSDNVEKYNKYISYQDVDSDARTPNIDNAKSNEIYNVKDYANKYIYFTVKSI
jgi:hypothetical protein